jgi:hypothetical protein
VTPLCLWNLLHLPSSTPFSFHRGACVHIVHSATWSAFHSSRLAHFAAWVCLCATKHRPRRLRAYIKKAQAPSSVRWTICASPSAHPLSHPILPEQPNNSALCERAPRASASPIARLRGSARAPKSINLCVLRTPLLGWVVRVQFGVHLKTTPSIIRCVIESSACETETQIACSWESAAANLVRRPRCTRSVYHMQGEYRFEFVWQRLSREVRAATLRFQFLLCLEVTMQNNLYYVLKGSIFLLKPEPDYRNSAAPTLTSHLRLHCLHHLNKQVVASFLNTAIKIDVITCI